MSTSTAYVLASLLLVLAGVALTKAFDKDQRLIFRCAWLAVALLSGLGLYGLKDHFFPDAVSSDIKQRLSSTRLLRTQLEQEEVRIARSPESAPCLALRMDVNTYIRRHRRAENLLNEAQDEAALRTLLLQLLDSNDVLYGRIRLELSDKRICP